MGKPPQIQVDGIKELRKSLRVLGDAERLKEVRTALKAGAEIVAREAAGNVPVGRTGKARASVRATASGNRAFVNGGRKTVPYYGWLDFGTRSPRRGRPRTVGPWKGSGTGPKEGRFIYPAIRAKRDDVVREIDRAMSAIVGKEGLS